MAITYSAQVGTTLTSFAMDETLGDQTQQTGNNTVVVSDDISTAGNGQIGSGANGIGVSYVGRLLIIDLGLSTQQIRICTAETAGTGNTFILTVSEDWDTNPVVTTDTIHVPYELADIEDGGVSGGFQFNAKTGLGELTNELLIGNATDPAGLQIVKGQALEASDEGTSISCTIKNNGYLDMGYEVAGTPINGGILTGVNNAIGEQIYQFQSGSVGRIYDSLVWGQLYSLQFECANGSDVTFWNTKLLSVSNELHLYDATMIGATVSGRGATTEIVRVDAGTSCTSMVLSAVDTLDTVADTTTETIELEGVIFTGVADLINIRNNKTWNMIDPVWSATTYTDFTWVGSTSNEVNDNRSIKVTVQTSAGTKLQDALINIYENTITDNLELKLVTAATTGYASGSFIYKKHVTNSSTTTYGGHALQCGKWLYEPFVSSQVSTDKFNGIIVLNPDNNISETTQATALTNGSGITWNKDTNPSELFEFTVGSGTLAVGMIITFTSGAIGTITELLDGDSTAGTIHLKDRNATAITNGDTFSRTGGTAGTFSGTYTNDSKQSFTIWIDGVTKSYQVIYDYVAALTTETTLSATGELIWEWCRSDQGQAVYATGSSFYTERSNSKGIIIVNGGGGTLDHVTDDAGVQWVPPSTTTVTFDKMKDDSEVRVYLTGTNTEVAGIENATAGSTDNRNFAWSSVATTVVDYVIHHFSASAPDYKSIRVNGYVVPAANVTIDIQQILDRNSI